MPLYFKNPGEIDLDAFTTFGVNVKNDDSAIGHFGTGAKFATGIVLRLGGSITIFRGLDKFEFFSKKTEIRGKEFDVVWIRHPDGHTHALGMTTDVGKNWEAWMCYRELRCNAQDENGFTTMSKQEPESGHTLIVVESRDLELVHQDAHKYFITTQPTHTLEEVELHSSESLTEKIFYKGVRVGAFSRPAMFRYNFTGGLMLTEDRTLSSPYYADSSLRRSIGQCTNEDLLYQIFTAHIDTMEHHINFESLGSASPQFLDVAERVVKQKPLFYNVTLRGVLARLRNHDAYEWVDASVLQAKMLMKAEKVCKDLGFDTTTRNIRIVENLGVNVLGCVEKGNIYLARRVFDMGTKMVCGTLLEEMIHAQLGLDDNSRDMQNFLLDRIMTLVEEKTGEPL